MGENFDGLGIYQWILYLLRPVVKLCLIKSYEYNEKSSRVTINDFKLPHVLSWDNRIKRQALNIWVEPDVCKCTCHKVYAVTLAEKGKTWHIFLHLAMWMNDDLFLHWFKFFCKYSTNPASVTHLGRAWNSHINSSNSVSTIQWCSSFVSAITYYSRSPTPVCECIQVI